MDRILSMEEAAGILGVDASRARFMAASGRFASARKVGNSWAALESEVKQVAEVERKPGRPTKPSEEFGEYMYLAGFQKLTPEQRSMVMMLYIAGALTVQTVQVAVQALNDWKSGRAARLDSNAALRTNPPQ